MEKSEYLADHFFCMVKFNLAFTCAIIVHKSIQVSAFMKKMELDNSNYLAFTYVPSTHNHISDYYFSHHWFYTKFPRMEFKQLHDSK